MDKTKTSIIASLLAASLFLCDSAFAAQLGTYVGGALAYSKRDADVNMLNFDRDILFDRLAFTTTEPGTVTTKDADVGYSATLGYRASPHWAFEGTYSKLSTLKYRSNGQQGYVTLYDFSKSPPEPVTYPGDADLAFDIEDSALQIDALYIIPRGYRWEFYGRGGIVVANTRMFGKIRDPIGTVKPEFSESSNTYHVGVGFTYSFLEVYGLRMEYNHAFGVAGNGAGGKHDIDALTLGVIVAF
ncbi:MAG TPA: outer membrane beta-barrel protein [Steroidobacteraceae bacterium]|nr:outer membrane beta-barrel protein [Steroidobacteraceae bacterium]